MKHAIKIATAWTALLLSIGLISACTKEPPAPPSTTVAQPTTSPTPTPSVAPEVAEAQEAAKALAFRYEALVDRIDTNPLSVTNDAIDAITISEENARTMGQKNDVIQTGERSTGPSTITRVLTREIDLSNDPTAQTPKIPTVKVLVCWDFTGTDYLNKEGKSILDPNRPKTGIKEYTVANYKYPDKSQWRVAKLTLLKAGAACPEK